MKTFRLIGMALLAVVMSMNFTSCSDDDEPSKNDDGVITNQKQLVELRMTYEDEVSITEYSYDSNGKLVSATNTEQYDGSTHTSTYTVTWGANKIIESRNGEAITYTLENGLITHTSDSDGGDLDNTDFTYNANNQLIKLQYDEEDYLSYTWQGEKLTKMAWSFSDEDIHELSYSGKTCKGYLPIMVWSVDDLRPLLEGLLHRPHRPVGTPLADPFQRPARDDKANPRLRPGLQGAAGSQESLTNEKSNNKPISYCYV